MPKNVSLLCFFFFFSLAPSSAHLNSFSFSTITVKEEAIQIEMRFTLICTLELFQVDHDHNAFLSQEELNSARNMMYYYLSNKIKVLCNGHQLKAVLKGLSFQVEEDDSYTVFDLVYPTKSKPEELILLCNVSEEADPYHRSVSEIRMGEKKYVFIFTNDNYFDSRNPPPAEPQDAEMIPSSTETTGE